MHGGRAVVRAILKVLTEMPGLRFAAPGEFARRAFDNGRLDLPQVEALAALVAAESEGQRRQALRGTSGALGQRVELWRSWLLEAKALVAAAIDFSDEGDTAGVEDVIRAPLAELQRDLATVLATANRGASWPMVSGSRSSDGRTPASRAFSTGLPGATWPSSRSMPERRAT